MSKWLKAAWCVTAAIIIICITFVLTLSWAKSRMTLALEGDEVKEKMNRLDHILDTYFIDDYDRSTMEQAAADGAADAMVAATGDRWSYYISEADMAEYTERMNNAYVGIGVTIQEADGGLEVISVTPGSPAEEAGVLPGDICTAVEGQSTAELGLTATQELVRGEEGTWVRLTFLRNGQTLERTVQRRAIISDVAILSWPEDDIALIRITDFDLHCAEQTLHCLEQAQEQGAAAIVFDVRFNPGGLKDEMVEILDVLLPEGEIFRSVDYRGVEEVIDSDAAHVQLPMVVLINEESYSAAEFFAAALQEYEAAQIVGTPTVGKGNFQYTIELGDGSAVNLSVGKYFTPKGVSLTDVGVTPDVVEPMTYDDFLSLYYGALEEADDVQLQAALRALKEIA